MIIQTSLRKNLGWQIAGGENNSLSGITAVLCNWSEFRLHPYASPPSWSELPWPDQTIQLLVGVLLCCVCVCVVWCSAYTPADNDKKKETFFFFISNIHHVTNWTRPAFFLLFPPHSLFFSFWTACLNQPTLLPLHPHFFFLLFFLRTPSPTSGYLGVYEWRWGKQQVWPAAPNTREAIQFRVGSKLCGHLRTARLRRSGARGGVEHVVPKNECDDLLCGANWCVFTL